MKMLVQNMKLESLKSPDSGHSPKAIYPENYTRPTIDGKVIVSSGDHKLLARVNKINKNLADYPGWKKI